MEYQLKKLPKSEIELTVTVSKEKWPEYEKSAANKLSNEVKVKGFRPGHVPEHILRQHLGEDFFQIHVQEIAIQKTYTEIVVKENIQVISRPDVKIEKVDPLTYTAKVAVMPEVEIKDHKSIKVKQEEVKVTDEDWDKVVKDLQRMGTTYKEVDRAAKKGDRVELDFEGFDTDGSTIEGTKSKNHPVILGENTLIPGFEEEVEGMKKGETKEFEIKFPKDYHRKDFQNRKVKFVVTLQMVEEADKAEFNEELLEKLTGRKQNLEDFEKQTKANILARKLEEQRQKMENEYIEKVIEKMNVELPESLLHEEAHYILEDMKDNMASKGITFEQFLEHNKTSEHELCKKYYPEAEKRLKIRLAIQYLLKEEDIKVEDKELKDEIEKAKAYHKDVPEKDLKHQIKNRLALDKLFAKVLGDTKSPQT